MKKELIVAFSVFLSIIITKMQAQEYPNRIDSIGFKQGDWKEYKAPYIAVENDVWTRVEAGSYSLKEIFPIILCLGRYEDGQKTGIWLEYHANGQKKTEINYRKGVPFGECRMFWYNGILKMECVISSEGNFPITIYNEDGTLLSEQEGIREVVIKSIYEN